MDEHIKYNNRMKDTEEDLTNSPDSPVSSSGYDSLEVVDFKKELDLVISKYGTVGGEASEHDASSKEMAGYDSSSVIDSLSLWERGFLLTYLSVLGENRVPTVHDRSDAFSIVWFGKRYKDLDDKAKARCRIDSWKVWASIEKKVGGMQALASLLGFDSLRLLSEVQRLLRIKRVSGIKKDGTVVEGEDGSTQFKALELLYKAFGILENANGNGGGMSLNINIGQERDVEALYSEDNVIISKATQVKEDD
jgi:hypothetical protein